MSALRQRAEEYLQMRRSLGYKLQRQGPMLIDFIGYLEATGASTVTIEAAVAWATAPAGAAPIWHKRRLTVVRGFARHLKALDPGCQVPPAALLPAPRTGSPRTCSRRRRSRRSSTLPGLCGGRCWPPPTRPSSACWP